MIELLLQDKEGFSVMETNNGQSVFSSIDDVNSENMKPRKNHLVHLLRCIVNNMNIAQRKMSFACFKLKEKNI